MATDWPGPADGDGDLGRAALATLAERLARLADSHPSSPGYREERAGDLPSERPGPRQPDRDVTGTREPEGPRAAGPGATAPGAAGARPDVAGGAKPGVADAAGPGGAGAREAGAREPDGSGAGDARRGGTDWQAGGSSQGNGWPGSRRPDTGGPDNGWPRRPEPGRGGDQPARPSAFGPIPELGRDPYQPWFWASGDPWFSP